MTDREAAIDGLIAKHDRLLRYCRRRYGRPGVGLTEEDYEVMGKIGLVRAYDSFDPCQGCRFETHLFWHVRYQIQEEYKRHRRRLLDTSVDVDLLAGPPPLPEETRHAYAGRLGAVIERLPHREAKELLRMVRSGMTISEAGAVMGLAPGAAAAAYARAVRTARRIASEQLTASDEHRGI